MVCRERAIIHRSPPWHALASDPLRGEASEPWQRPRLLAGRLATERPRRLKASDAKAQVPEARAR